MVVPIAYKAVASPRLDCNIDSAKKLLASGVPPKDVAKNIGVSISMPLPLGTSIIARLAYDFSVF